MPELGEPARRADQLLHAQCALAAERARAAHRRRGRVERVDLVRRTRRPNRGAAHGRDVLRPVGDVVDGNLFQRPGAGAGPDLVRLVQEVGQVLAPPKRRFATWKISTRCWLGFVRYSSFRLALKIASAIFPPSGNDRVTPATRVIVSSFAGPVGLIVVKVAPETPRFSALALSTAKPCTTT